MTKTNTTHLLLPERVRRMAGMAAARKGQTLSEYVAELIAANAKKTGIDALMNNQQPSESAGDPTEVK